VKLDYYVKVILTQSNRQIIYFIVLIFVYFQCVDLVVWLNVSWAVLDTLKEDEVIAVTARNSKGASEPVLLRELVFKDAAKRTGKKLERNFKLISV
jgi:hypothetical protein